MNRFLRIALIAFAALVALVAAAAVVLPFVVDPNDYKDEIAAAVEEKTGREMAMPGDIGLSIFPWLGVELGEVRLANAAGFGEAPFAEIGGAGVYVKLLPLLRKRIEIGTVSLTDMRLRLARKANGVTNWDDLAAAFASKEKTPAEPPLETEGGFIMPDLQVEAIEIDKAAVTFDDRAAGRRYEIDEMDFSTDRLNLAERRVSAAGGTGMIREILRGLDLDGRLTARRIEAADLHAENAELAVTARDGKLRIQPLGADLYDGKLDLRSTMDAAGERPGYTVEGGLSGLSLGPLLQDLAGSKKIEGLGDIDLDLTASGMSAEEMIRSLDGTVSFEFRDGVFNGFDLPRMLTMARRGFLEGGTTDVQPAGKTGFSRFAASFEVDDGRLSGRDLTLKTGAIEATGAGSYDLARNELDYTVELEVPETAGGDLAKLAGETIPVRLRGNLFSPRFSIDMASALEGAAKQKVEQEKRELKQKADEKVEEKKREVDEKVQEGLKKLFEKR